MEITTEQIKELRDETGVSVMQCKKALEEAEGDTEKAKAKELFEKDIDEKKPKEIRDKIMEGKLSSYFGEKVLLEQAFIKNPEVTIGSLIEQANQKFGERTEIGRFVRFSIN